jgi:hypothetical protein
MFPIQRGDKESPSNYFLSKRNFEGKNSEFKDGTSELKK